MLDHLEDKTHEVVFKAVTEPFDKAAVLKKNNERIDDPKRYEKNICRVGKILIDGKLED